MERTSIGELEELVLLAVSALPDEAYGVTVRRLLKERAERDVTLGTVHSTLHRLEDKGLLRSELGGATGKRGGRRKRLYTITSTGVAAAAESRAARDSIRRIIPHPHPLHG